MNEIEQTSGTFSAISYILFAAILIALPMLF